jgi:hypothetical protein
LLSSLSGKQVLTKPLLGQRAGKSKHKAVYVAEGRVSRGLIGYMWVFMLLNNSASNAVDLFHVFCHRRK